MMATTHVFAGVTIAVAIASVAPEFAPIAAIAAIGGGGFPDLDLYAGHRKTLHFPVYYSVGAVVAGIGALLVSTPWSVGLAAFLLAAAVHCLADALGGGLEPRPWEATSEKAVYDHVRGRWIPPRRVIAYDGSPGDLVLGTVLAIPGLLVFDGVIHDVLVVLLVVSIGYTIVRKRLDVAAEQLVDALPPRVLAYVPIETLPLESHTSEEEANNLRID